MSAHAIAKVYMHAKTYIDRTATALLGTLALRVLLSR